MIEINICIESNGCNKYKACKEDDGGIGGEESCDWKKKKT